MADIKIAPDILAILKGCTVSNSSKGWQIALPPGQLPPKTYNAVDAVLKLLGGKWNKSIVAHSFPDDPTDDLQAAIDEAFVADIKVRRQAFYTPDDLAAEIVLLFGHVEGCNVLEPSAGDGAIAKAAARYGANSITTVELHFEAHKAIEPLIKGYCHKFGVHPPPMWHHCGDFLTMGAQLGKFERVLMNPPFTRGQDVAHIQHAYTFLKPGGFLLAITPDKEHPKLDNLKPQTVRRFPAGAFKESGTMVATRLIKIHNLEN